MDELRFTERENYVVLITSSDMPAATRNAMAMAQREGKARSWREPGGRLELLLPGL